MHPYTYCGVTAALTVLCAAPTAVAAPDGGDRLRAQGVQVAPLGGAPALPAALTGRSWLVADAGTGDVLAAFNAHEALPPASTLKMLFADTVLPKLNRDDVHHVTRADLDGLGSGSSMVGVKEEQDYRVDDLWRGVFLASGNDAVHVLAAMNGGIPQTVTQMQDRARALHADDTHVVTPDGYDENGQVSSAYDLTLFARDGLRNADFRGYCSTRTAQFPGLVDKATGQRGSFTITNTDRLLGRYPGLIGVKNGYTSNAGATYTGAAERDGRTVLVTVMHPQSNGKVYDEAAALLDWGFAADGKVTPVGRLAEPEPPVPTPVARPLAAAAGGSSAHTSPLRPAGGRLGTLGWAASGVCVVLVAAVAGLRMRTVRRRRTRPLPVVGGAAGGSSPVGRLAKPAAGATALRRPTLRHRLHRPR